MSEDPNAGSGGVAPQGDTGAGAGAGGTVPPSFIESLPEDLRGNETIKAFDSAEKLARAHLETLGKLPAVPEKPELYELAIPEGHPVNQDFVNQFKGWAHEAGLTKDQAAKLGESYIKAEAAFLAEAQKAEEGAIESIKQEWVDKFEANTEIAKKAVNQFCTKEEIKWLDESRLGNNPVLVRMFHRIGKAISEDALPGGGQGAGGSPPNMQRTAGGTPQLSFPSMEKKQ